MNEEIILILMISPGYMREFAPRAGWLCCNEIGADGSSECTERWTLGFVETCYGVLFCVMSLGIGFSDRVHVLVTFNALDVSSVV